VKYKKIIVEKAIWWS